MKKRIYTVRGSSRCSIYEDFSPELSVDKEGSKFWWKEWRDSEDYYISDPGMSWEEIQEQSGNFYYVSAGRFKPKKSTDYDGSTKNSPSQNVYPVKVFNEKSPFAGIALKDETKCHIFLVSSRLIGILNFIYKDKYWSQLIIDEDCTCQQDQLRVVPIYQIKAKTIVKWLLKTIHTKKKLWMLGYPIGECN